jgi:hypothetical protein
LRKAAAHGLGLDEGALCVGIRNAEDAACRKALGHPQAERSPAAAELEHVLAVDELRALACRRRAPRPPLRSRPFTPSGHHPLLYLRCAPKHGVEERRRQLVVLLVGLVSEQRERAVAQRGDERFAQCGGAGRVAGADLAQSLAQQPADAGAHERVRNAAFLGPLDRQVRHLLRSPIRMQAAPARLYERAGKRITQSCDPIDGSVRRMEMKGLRALESPRGGPAGARPASLSLVGARRNWTVMPSGDELIELMRAVAGAKDRAAFAVLFKHLAPRVKAYLIRSARTARSPRT